MRTLTVAEMREADRRAIEGLGIPSEALMDRAGHAVFQRIPQGPVVVVCGKGNNGGDGFVIARYCFLAGYETTLVMLFEEKFLSDDARTFKQVYTRLGGICIEATTDEKITEIFGAQQPNGLWVDAMLGTGTRGEVSSIIRTAIEAWPNEKTIAVDIPSGLNADTGEVCGAAIVASETVTLQYAKVGFQAESAKPYIGSLHVVDIGIPDVCSDDDAWNKLEFD